MHALTTNILPTHYQRITNALPTRYQRVSQYKYMKFNALPRVTIKLFKKSIYYISLIKKVVTRANALHSQKNQCNTKLTGGNASGNALVTRP